MFTGPESVIELLLQNGASANAINNLNNTVLILAIQSGESIDSFKSCKKYYAQRVFLKIVVLNLTQGSKMLPSYSFKKVLMSMQWESMEKPV